jgi:hypothetical protein
MGKIMALAVILAGIAIVSATGVMALNSAIAQSMIDNATQAGNMTGGNITGENMTDITGSISKKPTIK